MYFKRCTAVILIICTISFVAAISVEAVRTAIWNAIVDLFDSHISVSYTKELPPPTVIEEIKEINPGREDWEKQVFVNSDYHYSVIYLENGIKVLSYSQELLDKHDPWYDNQNSVVKNVRVGKDYGVLVFRTSQETYSLLWNDEKYSYMLTAHSTNISEKALIEIAETIN
ncbi:MAG: DUF4367 domain-containing protein [Clostridia bacterium]|nr:DUF4367 domain-containing protein [Clostridia bacterium]